MSAANINEHVVKTVNGVRLTNPPVLRMLFDDTRFGIVWLVVRVLLGLTWLESGLNKLSDPAWIQTGEALKSFWANAVKVPETGRPPITFGWYRDFIQSMLDAGSYTWFAKAVTLGEVLIGIALILGLFVGLFAFLGAFMNWNYLMAGSASTNPILFVAALLLMFAWKTAGYYGLDRFMLPRLGAAWSRREAEALRASSTAAIPRRNISN